jgi:oxygen-independent coproporphyrinogen-3 oxidase
MDSEVLFDRKLIEAYDIAGPRYTSYPTAVQFNEAFTVADYRRQVMLSNSLETPLSLYIHLPFCATVCFYCACSKIITANRRRAAPYLQRLHKEIALQGHLFQRDRPVEQLHWGGGTPTFLDSGQMRTLMAQTRSHFSLLDDDSGEYSIEIDPREVNADTIVLLRELGFNRLSMGVQDFDADVQRAVNRIQPRELTETALVVARDAGFRSISLDLIYGLPLQTVASFDRTLDEVIALDPDRLSVFNYAHLPAMFKVQRQIDATRLPPREEKIEILKHIIQRLGDAGYVYIGMDHFAKPQDELAIAQRSGTLYRNFQGYSTHADCDLIGLGMTAIGKVGDSYSQNAKTLDDYYAALDDDRLPIYRGIRLSADDCLRRAVISELICHAELNFIAIEDQYAIRFHEYFKPELSRLAVMEGDGLLQLRADGIAVTPAGRLLIRNICMVFDRYLEGNGEKRFSRAI